MRFLFKILKSSEWAAACGLGRFSGSAADIADGFIHLSAAHQVRDTAAKHFAETPDLVIAAFNEADLAGLKWEPARGGDLFPHVYGDIPTRAAVWVKELPIVDGAHRFPREIDA